MSNFPYKKKFYKRKSAKNEQLQPSDVSIINSGPSHGYKGFKLYFPDEDSIDVNILLVQLKISKKFIQNNKQQFDYDIIRKDKRFLLDYKLLNKTEIPEWTDLNTQIIENFEYILACFGLAMHQTILEETQMNGNLGKIRVKLTNFEPVLQLKDLKVDIYNKLVTVSGTVIRIGGVKIQCEYLAFSCSSCNGEQIIKQIDSCFTQPTKCLTKYCQVKCNFIPLHSSPHTRTVNCQIVKIQELVGSDCSDYGRTPRTLECELMEDLVNSCMPGDDVTITGIIKVKKDANQKKYKESALFSLYMNAITVVNIKNRNLGSFGASERVTFRVDDYYTIQKVHSQPNLFKYLVQSLCPSIFGHEIVKAGLLLALFGGSSTTNLTRPDSHVLMIGDPGLGKSQMLHACTNVAPRGVYVCGNTSTSSGLTVTLCRESGGEFALEAGALMLADQGCCCIDEFDKMPNQHSALLEAMEQQTISIAKAGITCTIPSRATILAAANPAGGHYNKAKTVIENLKMSAPMLSRFDLIFVLLDNPDKGVDSMMSQHVLGMFSLLSNSTLSNTNKNNDQNECLRSKLQIDSNEILDPLEHALFCKYIAYAQKYVNPVLSQEAKAYIKEFYLDLRKKFRTGDSTPVTTRQLQSLIRLTQARARLELREEATGNDAKDVIEIMQTSLSDIFTDEAGILDTTRSLNGTGMTSRNKALKLLAGLQQLSKIETKSHFQVKEIKALGERIGIPSNKLQGLIEKLNIQGYLLYKGSDNYQLLSA